MRSAVSVKGAISTVDRPLPHGYSGCFIREKSSAPRGLPKRRAAAASSSTSFQIAADNSSPQKPPSFSGDLNLGRWPSFVIGPLGVSGDRTTTAHSTEPHTNRIKQADLTALTDFGRSGQTAVAAVFTGKHRPSGSDGNSETFNAASLIRPLTAPRRLYMIHHAYQLPYSRAPPQTTYALLFRALYIRFHLSKLVCISHNDNERALATHVI